MGSSAVVFEQSCVLLRPTFCWELSNGPKPNSECLVAVVMLYRLIAYYKRVGFSKLRTPPLQHLTPHVQMSSISPCSVVWELGLRKPVQMLTFWIMLFPRVVKFFGPGVSCLLPPPMKLWQANLEVYKCGSILDLSQLVT